MKKIISLCLIAAMVLSLSTTAFAVDGTWQQDGYGWWYLNADGSYPVDSWLSDGGSWYYFGSDGYMATGWVFDGEAWYYMNPSGAMETGWLKIGGYWYYFDASGVMATGTQAIDGVTYEFAASGEWLGGGSGSSNGYDFQLLNWGTSIEDVLAVQQLLLPIGCNSGPYTRNALFASAPGQTIVPAEPEVPAQPSQPANHVQLSLGSSGEDVLIVQQKLLSLGYNPGALDGYFGPETEAAVKEFQAANGLYVDGIVGTITYNTLFSAAGAKPEQSRDDSRESIYEVAKAAVSANSIKLTFHQDGWYVARLAVQLYDKTEHTLKWVYSSSRAKGQEATVSVDADKYEINRIGYQIWFFGWDNDYMNVPYANTDNATEFTLSGSGDFPEFTWK